MKQERFHISLYVIIPFIFAGFAIFSALLAYRVTRYGIEARIDPATWVFWLIIAISLLAFGTGLAIVRFLLRPVEEFVRKASELPALRAAGEGQKKRGDKLAQFASVFDRVTTVLSRIDARHFFPEIVGESIAIRGIFSLIMKVAPSDTTVLVLGESGTGKELIASSLHAHSHRKDKPFVKLNCAAIPRELLESELFGHEKGAFTGASAFKPGKFDLAAGGTIFLDEIGDMPLELQAKILRVLQEKEFYRVGGTRTVKVDVRFIASTNKNLEKLVAEGAFREDLYYRLSAFTLHLPPLRERKEDIPLLVDHFLQKAPKKVDISSSALQMLMAYPWPGNIRELKHVIEAAALIAEGGHIEPAQLPEKITRIFDELPMDSEMRLPASMSLDDKLNEIERNLIIDALIRTGGVQSRATELLGINQRSLWHRIRKLGIDVKSIKKYESRVSA